MPTPTPTIIDGLPTLTINALNAYSGTLDPVNDLFVVYQNSSESTVNVTRNTALNLASAPVGLTDTQTLTNKTMTSPTINTPVLGGTITGTYTFGGTPTFPSSVATLTGTQTLTNKTLTSPTINSPAITNATLSADTITGYSTSNAGTIYGVAVSGGLISGTSLTSASITSTQIATNGVGASNLATTAITLGKAIDTTAHTSLTQTSVTAIGGMSVTVTIPAGGRTIRVSAVIPSYTNTTGALNVWFSIWDGTVGSGTQLNESALTPGGANYIMSQSVSAIITPSAGSKTYNVGYRVNANAITINNSSTVPSYILVEAI